MINLRQFTRGQLLTALILSDYQRISDVTLWLARPGIMGLSLVEHGFRKSGLFDRDGLIIGDWTVESVRVKAS